MPQHGFGHLVQRAVAATGNQQAMAGVERLADQPLDIPGLPGNAHGQIPAEFALPVHGGAHLIIERLLAVQDEQGFGLAHESASFLSDTQIRPVAPVESCSRRLVRD